ncbi:MAG TPA: GTP cyclohydrolase I, partial [Chthoniobacterales bacterium]|nr:GTP cyclohydrolase I [Chthoniobacterales bacterium]
MQETDFEISERLTSAPDRMGTDRLEEMERLFGDLLDAIGEDRTREGLRKTPDRAARAFEFITAGYRQSVEEAVNGAIFDSDASEIVMVKDIELYS